MRKFKNLREMKKALKETKSGVAGDTIFSAKAILYIAERLEDLIKISKHQMLGDFQLFMSYSLKEGKTFNEALKEWRTLNG